MKSNAIISAILIFLAGCGSSDANRDRVPDGSKQGLFVSEPDEKGYVTSAFQGVHKYDPVATMYICATLAIQSGRMPNAVLILGKAEQANFGKVDEKSSGFLLKDAENFWAINQDVDQEVFWNDRCKVPMENIENLYG